MCLICIVLSVCIYINPAGARFTMPALKFFDMVIQRWQSVMLLIAAGMMGLFSFVSLGQILPVDCYFNISALGILSEDVADAAGVSSGVYTYVAFTVGILAAIVALMGIFCYKNKKLHKKTVVFSMLFSALSAALVAYNVYDFASAVDANVKWSFAICFPVLAFVAEIIAYRMICSDWKKLEAADRLR